MTTVGITGATGFLGWHVACRLRSQGIPSVAATRDTFADPELLRAFVERSTVVLHLAGVNRAGTDEEITNGNLDLARQLVTALEAADSTLPILYSNSTHSRGETVYGQAKRDSGKILAAYCESAGTAFLDLVLPHLFGEFGVPHYNSAVTTFAYALASGGAVDVNRSGRLELLHAQDVAARIVMFIENPVAAQEEMTGRQVSVGEVWDLLAQQHARYVDDCTVPAFADRFELRIFNTLRSQLFQAGHYPVDLTVHSDPRGGFAELCRADGIGQTSISTSEPGVSRGDHFHFDKIERFVVIDGEAEISLRRVLTDETVTFEVTGENPAFIDMPPMVTHNIVNASDSRVTTMFWAGDHFDPNNPDTYVDPVEQRS